MVGAANNGLAGVGVLYGYWSQEELVRAGARTIVARVDELGAALDALS
jgi:phosphoglycolate phosphatase